MQHKPTLGKTCDTCRSVDERIESIMNALMLNAFHFVMSKFIVRPPPSLLSRHGKVLLTNRNKWNTNLN